MKNRTGTRHSTGYDWTMTPERSDALVLFGVTGDLARKSIFPALHAMARKGTLDFPVIGVASSKLSVEQLRERVVASLAAARAPDDPAALARLFSALRYVSGDYNDAATFTALKQALGGARRPAFYLAIPPSLFETVIQGLGREQTGRQRARHRRKALRPRPRLGARAQPRGHRGVPGGARSSASITSWPRKRS